MSLNLISQPDTSMHELLLPYNTNPNNKHLKKWRAAYCTIYCSRALLSIKTSSYTVIDFDEPAENKFNINKESLIKLVKEKRLDQLEELGGLDGLAKVLETSAEKGILSFKDEEISRRRQQFGSNTYMRPPTKNLYYFLMQAAFLEQRIVNLLVVAVLSIVLGIVSQELKEGCVNGVGVFFHVFLFIAVAASSNYKLNRQFDDELYKDSNIDVEVNLMRGGKDQQIPISDIVIGDIVSLRIGDQIPADGLLIEGNSLQVDESSVTGESDPVEVNKIQNPFLLSGSDVVDGSAKMLVTSVGMNTTWGQTMSQISCNRKSLLKARREMKKLKTVFQARLEELTSSIGKVCLTVALVVLVVLLVRYFTGNITDQFGTQNFHGRKTKFVDIANSVVGILIAALTIRENLVAMPEALPLAMTLILAYSMKRTAEYKTILARKLSAWQTMGSTTTICFDKSGTLTLNHIKVTSFCLGLESIAREEEDYSTIAPNVYKLLQEAVVINTINLSSEIDSSSDPMENAILSWAIPKFNVSTKELIRSCSIHHRQASNPWSRLGGVSMRSKLENIFQLHYKGSVETILAMCSSYYDASGIIRDFDGNHKMRLEKMIQNTVACGLRCIAFAHKQISADDHKALEPCSMLKEESLVFLGFVSIKNPCQGVEEVVRVCQNAGVNVKMITGDNSITATAIATECGILGNDCDMSSGVVIEGEEFRSYSPEERVEKVDKILVMARASPSDKRLMVQCLKEKGNVVAVIGDDINDALALKEADTGLSLGIEGTKFAKHRSDIVILDDQFASVATILKWGRCVNNNMQKFIQFQLTPIVAILVFNFVVAISTGEVPLTAAQLVLMKLILNTLSALALATEKPTNELMTKPPLDRTGPLITNIMWRNILPQATYQVAILLTLQFRGSSIFNVSDGVRDTLIFNMIMLCQVFNGFNASRLEKRNVFKGIYRKQLFLGMIATTIVLQVLVVEFLNKFTDTERLNLAQWASCIGIAAVSLPVSWIFKFVPVPEKPILSNINIKFKYVDKFFELGERINLI